MESPRRGVSPAGGGGEARGREGVCGEFRGGIFFFSGLKFPPGRCATKTLPNLFG